MNLANFGGKKRSIGIEFRGKSYPNTVLLHLHRLLEWRLFRSKWEWWGNHGLPAHVYFLIVNSMCFQSLLLLNTDCLSGNTEVKKSDMWNVCWFSQGYAKLALGDCLPFLPDSSIDGLWTHPLFQPVNARSQRCTWHAFRRHLSAFAPTATHCVLPLLRSIPLNN